MYKYVPKKEASQYKRYCSNLLVSLRDSLKKEEKIIVTCQLIGSGAKNMVTRNGKGPFDLDYNLVLSSIPEEYANNPGKVKEIVRLRLDALIKEDKKNISPGKNSTSSITYIFHSHGKKKVDFKLDIAIILEDKKTAYRLIYDKPQNQYIWNELPHYAHLPEKVEWIKKSGKTNDLRDDYLRLKNMYLERQDDNHPSFVVYAEAVEEVYQKC